MFNKMNLTYQGRNPEIRRNPEITSKSSSVFDPIKQGSKEEILGQYEVQVKGSDSYNLILSKFRDVEKKISEEKIIDELVKFAIEKMRRSPIDYGLVDLNNDQHLQLLYYYISYLSKNHLIESQFLAQRKKSQERLVLRRHDEEKKVLEEEKWEKDKLLSPDPKNTYKTAFLGAGSSIAYYINYLGKNFDHSESIILGMPQPWGGERGPGVLAQPEHMIIPEQQFRKAAEINDKWADRKQLSQLIENVFNEPKIKREKENIMNIERKGEFYSVIYGNKRDEKTIYVKDVIIGMGSGKHSFGSIDAQKVAKTDQEVETKKRRIMNIDMFSRVADRLENADRKKETVIVLAGANAAVDTAFDIIRKGYRIKWVVGKKGVNFLPGLPNNAVRLPFLKYLSSTAKDMEHKQEHEQQIKILEENAVLEDLYQCQNKETFGEVAEDFKRRKFDHIYFTTLESAEQTDNGVVVKLQNNEEVKGDYLVYGMGPDESPLALLDENIQENLVIDHDLNQRFKQKGNTEPTALALKTRDGSLKIIGVMAHRMFLRNRDGSPIKAIDDSLPSNTTVLTVVRSQIEALHNFMPHDINEQANFITDDRTMLAVHISAKYPTIADYELSALEKGEEIGRESSDSLLGQLVEMIIQSRRQAGMKSEPNGLLPDGPNCLAVPPNGRKFQEHWEKALRMLENDLQQKKKGNGS